MVLAFKNEKDREKMVKLLKKIRKKCEHEQTKD